MRNSAAMSPGPRSLCTERRPKGQAGGPYHRVDAVHDRCSGASPLAPAQHAVRLRGPLLGRFERRCTLSAQLRQDAGGGAGEERKVNDEGKVESRCRGREEVDLHVQRDQIKRGGLSPV